MKYEDFKDNETLKLFEQSGGNILLTTVDAVINWGRSNSVWPLTFATSCCGIEMMATGASRHDFARFGIPTPLTLPSAEPATNSRWRARWTSAAAVI